MTFTQEIFITGLLSGLGSTIIMTIFMLMGKASKMSPMDLPVMLGKKLLGADIEEKQARMSGMILHLIIGVLWGIIYVLAVTNQIYFTTFDLQSGLLFALIPWIVMMIILMPMMGMGLFGLKKSPKVALMTLVLHLIYGASLAYLSPLFS